MNALDAKSTANVFELPIGFPYQGKRYKQVLFTEITGEDEDTFASERPVELKIAEILSRRIAGFCEEGGPEHISIAEAMDLPINDTEFALICLRRLSFGDMLKVKTKCPKPKCEYEASPTVSLAKLEVKPFVEKPLEHTLSTGKKVKFRLATGRETQWTRKVVKRLKLKEDEIPLSLMMARFIAEIEGEVFSLDEAQGNKVIGIMQKLSMRERTEIRNYLEGFGGDVDKSLIVECPSCGNEYTTRMEFGVDFFFPKE